MRDHTSQRKCEHPKARVLQVTEEGDNGVEDKRRRYPVLHMHCPACGMFFGRGDFSKERKGTTG